MSGQLTKATGLTRVNELYQNRTERAKELKKEGRRIIGYLCGFSPPEMMTALDMVPLRIMGNVNEPITQADAYLETIMCPFVRSCFDLAMKGNYDFLDGLLVPHSCDTVARIKGIWSYYKPTAFSYFMNVPHMVHSGSREFFKNELQSLRSALEEFAGSKLTDARLAQAVKLHNENRALLRQLYYLRKGNPPLLSGAETTRTLVVNMSLPVQEGNELLRQVIKDASSRQTNRPGKKSARIMIYGSEIDNDAFIKLVEDSGANVVIDDLCIGTKYFWHDVKPTADPLDGIADRYLDKLTCPRTYRDSPGEHKADLEQRFGHLKNFASDWKIDAAILYVMRYCDTFELDAPDVREYLEGLGYSVLHLEDDYSMATMGQLTTRIQSFLEMIQ
ncbi:MAG: 2-hydroxyacyl-CoA dehydratase family protein [Dehalococcoidia bacterium]